MASTGVKVYRVKYGDARRWPRCSAIFSLAGASTGLELPSNQIAPNSGATTLSAVERLTGGPRQEAPERERAAGGPTRSGRRSRGRHLDGGDARPLGRRRRRFRREPSLPDVRITADVANNSILVYANEEDYRIVERAINQLDRPRLQVAIDVTIAEVTLNDQLDYGVQFFLNQGITNERRLEFAANHPDPAGFQLVLGNALSPRVVLNALHQYTDVKIFSNPSLVVVDNQPATLEVGDQVPITTGSATVLSANNAVVNTVDYKNTGIILHVQPRVNSNGTVLLDIEQEISAVVNDLTAGSAPTSTTTNLTPTISVRRVKSELSVANGQTVLLAGLISETQNVAHSGIPILDQIPFLGNAVSSKNNSISRTELILFIGLRSSVTAPTRPSSRRNCGRRCVADNWVRLACPSFLRHSHRGRCSDSSRTRRSFRTPLRSSVDSLEHVAAERRQAPRRGLRLGWRLAGAGVLLASFAVAPGVEGALGGALGLLMLGIA